MKICDKGQFGEKKIEGYSRKFKHLDQKIQSQAKILIGGQSEGNVPQNVSMEMVLLDNSFGIFRWADVTVLVPAQTTLDLWNDFFLHEMKCHITVIAARCWLKQFAEIGPVIVRLGALENISNQRAITEAVRKYVLR